MDDDVPTPIDLRDPATASTWAREADIKRPWRADLRRAIAEALITASSPIRRVLELGCGPGLLAEEVLRTCALDDYTLLDFSPPMLELSRERVGGHRAARFVLADLKHDEQWPALVEPPFDAIVTMQAVHELRHKRHAPRLYRQSYELLRPGGTLIVCDHVPRDDTARITALFSTETEQLAALTAAGFASARTRLVLGGLYVCEAERAR